MAVQGGVLEAAGQLSRPLCPTRHALRLLEEECGALGPKPAGGQHTQEAGSAQRATGKFCRLA